MPNTQKDDSFLGKGYKIPSTSKYTKFAEGINTFRILAKPIKGMEYWKTTEDGKRVPIRKRMTEQVVLSDVEIDPRSGKREVKHFWAMPVYNYKDECIQIMEITQKTIQEAILSYSENPKWGSPLEYDITINKTGTGKETTKYIVDHDPKEALKDSIAKLYANTKINMEALFDGADPFEKEVDTLESEIAKMGEEEADKMPF